ncbi:MAG TPA: MlaD family protein [Longimicrobiaceae bacterium]|nr:MlaD family protein [Longimicrobiaceae bacterium]
MTRSGAPDGPRAATPGRMTEDDLLLALPARSATRELRVGAFVLVGVLAFFVALFTLTDVGTFRGRYYASTVVEDAGGLRNGDPVQMRGVNIGRIAGFDIVPEGVSIRMELQNEYDVPVDSHVVLRSSGLLGGMVADVVPGNAEAELDDGDVIPGTSESGFLNAAVDVGTRADSVLGRMARLLSDRTVGAVGESAVELQILLEELSALASEQRAALSTLSSSLTRSAEGVESAVAGPELARAVANIDSLTARLDETSASLARASTSLETVLGRVERGEGTLGLLSADESLYVNLNSAAANIDKLIAEIRANPSKFFDVRVF